MAKSTKGSQPAVGFPGTEDWTALLRTFQVPGVDVSALLEWQRKDLEALAEANREAYEGYKALIERRNEILQETLRRWQAAMQDLGDPDALSKQGEVASEGIQRAIDNFRELSEMEVQARARAWKVVQERLQENMQNLQSVLQPKSE